MLASLLISVLCLIGLQVFLVVKVADWMSASTDGDRTDSRNYVNRSAGRYVGA